MRISEILNRNSGSIEGNRIHTKLNIHSSSVGNDLTTLTRALTKDSRAKHSRYLDWSRAFLSKSRYMSGLHCPKKLWQTVYDPEPLQDSLPGTVKGMGIEVGVKARLLWPGGVFIDTLDSAEAIRRTKALLTDLTVPAIFEAALTYDGVLVRVDVLERLPDGCWRLNEVKSSTRIRNEHLEDVALQTYVVAGTGLELAEAYLVYVNDNYVQGEGIDWNAQTASGSRIRCGYCARRRRSPGSDTARTTAVSADHRHSHAGH